MKQIKKVISKLFFCSQKIWYRKWMERFTASILFLLLFNIPIFFVLLFCHLHFGLAFKNIQVLWTQYISLSKVMVSAYSVAWIGAMAKEYAAKNAEENMKLKKQIKELKKRGDDDAD